MVRGSAIVRFRHPCCVQPRIFRDEGNDGKWGVDGPRDSLSLTRDQGRHGRQEFGDGGREASAKILTALNFSCCRDMQGGQGEGHRGKLCPNGHSVSSAKSRAMAEPWERRPLMEGDC